MISTNLDLRIKLEREPDGAWVKATDIGLIVARGVWPRAVPKTSYIDIPGSDSKLDLSEVLRSEAPFSNVTGTILFIVLNRDKFDLSRFINHYHGRRVMIRMGDDDDYYRVGRCWVTADDRKRVLREFTLTVDTEPYRYALRTKSVEVPIVAAQHPQKAKVLTYRKYHVDPDDPYTYDKTTGTFVFNTSLYTDNPAGTLGLTINSETWYSFSWSYYGSKEPYCYLADGTEIKTPGHFYSGHNTQLRVDIGSSITGMVLMSINLGVTAINEGRKILTPRVLCSTPCTVAGNLGAVKLDADDYATVDTTSVYKFTSAAVGKKFFYININGVNYGQSFGTASSATAVTEADITAGLRAEISTGMLSVRFYNNAGTIITKNLDTVKDILIEFGTYANIADISTLDGSSTSDEDSGGVLYDFQLAPGVNTVIAYADSAGGTVKFTYREGLL